MPSKQAVLEALPLAAASLRLKAKARLSAFDGSAEPLRWFREYLGLGQMGEEGITGQMYPKQVEMIEAVRDNRQVSICGANSSGKDFLAARIALWWISTFHPAKVILTAPSYRQAYQVSWMELATAYRNAKKPLGGSLYETPLLKYTEEQFAMGFSTDRPFNITGFHSPHLLLIISEAHGMEQATMDALRRLNPERLVLIGNPLSESGTFFDSHHERMDQWKTIEISAYDTPNVIEGKVVIPGLVTVEDIEGHKDAWGEDSDAYRTTVLGQWGTQTGMNVVVPLSWARRAEKTELTAEGIEVLAVDVARFGNDRTVAWSRRGKVAKLVHRAQGHDLMQTVGVIKTYKEDHPQCHIIVDAVGLGAGVVDRLREQGIGVFAFQGGESAEDSSRFVNRNAESWWRMRRAFESDFDMQPDDATVGQLSSRKYVIQSDKRIKLESKEDLHKAGIKSPDEADALAMTFAYGWMLPQQGSRLTADSDVGERTGEEHIETQSKSKKFGIYHDGPSVVTRRDPAGLSGYLKSRWAKIRC